MGKKPLVGLIGLFGVGILLTGCNCCKQNHKQAYAGGAADSGMGLTSWNKRTENSQLANSTPISGANAAGPATSGSLSNQASSTGSGQQFASPGASASGGVAASPLGGGSPSTSLGAMPPAVNNVLTPTSGNPGLSPASGGGKAPSLGGIPAEPGMSMSNPVSGSGDPLSPSSGIQTTSASVPGGEAMPGGGAMKWQDSPKVREAAYSPSAADAALMATNNPSRPLAVPSAPVPPSLASIPTTPNPIGTKTPSPLPPLPDGPPSIADVPASSPPSSPSSPSAATPSAKTSASNSSYPPLN